MKMLQHALLINPVNAQVCGMSRNWHRRQQHCSISHMADRPPVDESTRQMMATDAGFWQA